ncbi:hypothetical protein G9P44_002805 [Scheffersomyces stipitis]|nr:hypothetical protein G9P44_002805 [Scheffersomyces stipitis]
MIRYIKGDLLGHLPPSKSSVAVFAHACNCQGVWGGGIAAVLRVKFPSTYPLYSGHCQEKGCDPHRLLGTSVVVPSQASDPGNIAGYPPKYIACLFTSDFAQTQEEIVAYTDSAIEALVDQLKELHKTTAIETGQSGKIVVNMPKINAGIFAVPWEKTEAVLKKYDVEFNVYVI